MSVEQVAPGIRRVAVRSPTLPPATTTNVYVVGEDRLTVFDPASPWEDEQGRLHAALDALGKVERIVLTHHHVDHVSGAEALRRHVGDVPIAAHPITADLVRDQLRVDELLHEGTPLQAQGVRLDPQFTPGHAPGHLVFQDGQGAVIAGDMVAGVGTILIDPMEGDLGHYLASLAAMQRRAPALLLPSHGPVLPEAVAVLGFYVAHRHLRTEQIRAALEREGGADPLTLVPRVYGTALDPAAWPFAAVQILAHLRWMEAQGMVVHRGDTWSLR